MGLIRFVVSPPQRITEEVLEQAYMSGVDRVAWKIERSSQFDQLIIRRSVSESGNLHIPWPVENRGLLSLSTASLMEREGPYHLPLELARGTISQLDNQLAQWQTLGLAVPEAVAGTLSEATVCLGRAAVSQEQMQESVELAERSIRLALDAGDLLAASFVDQTLSARRSAGKQSSLLLGANLGGWPPDGRAAEQYAHCFNAAAVPFCWRQLESSQTGRRWDLCDRQVEWCRAQGIKVCGGPLVQLDPWTLPDWLYLYEGDFENILSCVTEFLQAVVTRYRGKVDLWQCAGRLVSGEALMLSEEEKFRLGAAAVATVRSSDPDAPILLSFDQPWGEYLSRRDVDLPPLYFADALARAGLDLTGLALEINLGYRPDGTLPRTLIEFSRQLDHWGLLGLPLLISITVPSADSHDPLARRRPEHPPAGWTPESQRVWAARYVPLIFSKPLVQGVLWNQLHDAQPHDFPHGGLFSAQGEPKPAMDTLGRIRETILEWNT
jgi:hypothetical protein